MIAEIIAAGSEMLTPFRQDTNSLYLTAKPAFFGSNPWPWVDATGSTQLFALPAGQRYNSILGTEVAPAAPTGLVTR